MFFWKASHEVLGCDAVVWADPRFHPGLLNLLLHQTHNRREGKPGVQMLIGALHRLGVPPLLLDVLLRGVAPHANVHSGPPPKNLIKGRGGLA